MFDFNSRVKIMKNYFIAELDGTQKGPYSEETLVLMLNSGEITPDTFLWCEGMDDWKPYNHIFSEVEQVTTGNTTRRFFLIKLLADKKKLICIIAGIVLTVICGSLFVNFDSQEAEIVKRAPQTKAAVKYKKMSRKAARAELKARKLELNDDEAILEAAYNNPELLNIFIQAGVDVNEYRYGYLQLNYLLSQAAKGGNPECVKLLLDAGAKVDNRESDKETALHCLFSRHGGDRHNLAACAKLLIDAGIDIHATDSSGRQALYAAAQDENGTDALIILINAGANIHFDSKFGQAIHAAAGCENSENLKILIEAGADINAQRHSLSPLELSVRVPENLEILLAAGAKGKDEALRFALQLIEIEYFDEETGLASDLYWKLEKSIAILRAAGADETKASPK